MEIPDTVAVFAVLYLATNLAAAVGFAWDKRQARRNAWRTSETTLLVLALLGPFGAYAAMRQLRHKTQKTRFLLVPLFLFVHTALIIWFLSAQIL